MERSEAQRLTYEAKWKPLVQIYNGRVIEAIISIPTEFPHDYMGRREGRRFQVGALCTSCVFGVIKEMYGMVFMSIGYGVSPGLAFVFVRGETINLPK
jgi:hypothetical protein